MSVDEAMYVHISSSPLSHQIQIQKGKNTRIRILYSVNFREPLVHVINRLSVNLDFHVYAVLMVRVTLLE